VRNKVSNKMEVGTMRIPFVTSNSGLTAYVGGEAKMVAKDHIKYELILSSLLNDVLDEDSFNLMYDAASAIFQFSDGKVKVGGDRLFYDGVEMHNALVTRTIDLIKKNQSIQSLVNFMNNLVDNPSFRAVTELFDFLDACSLPITPSGCFLAYKKVNGEYKSIHANPDGTYLDNSIGKVVEMRRNLVDENSEQTCSSGLHCCSFDYLKNYGDSSWDKVVIVQVNPRDVVAVPKDYGNQKMRVCKYVVVGEIPNDQVTQLKDKYSTSDYSDEDYDEDEDYDCNPCECDDPCDWVPPVPKNIPPKTLPAPVSTGNWICSDGGFEDKYGSWTTMEYYGVTKNQAKAAFAKEFDIDYIDVRVRKIR